MSAGSILQEIRRQAKKSNNPRNQMPETVVTHYTSLPVEIPSDFLASLPDPINTLNIKEIEFGTGEGRKKLQEGRKKLEREGKIKKLPELPQLPTISANIPEHDGRYAVIIDNVLTEQECKQLIHMAEQSAGGHQGEESAENNGWKPAMVNGGFNKEYLDLEYRNSDRIIWDNQKIINRIWERVMQHPNMKTQFTSKLGTELGLGLLGRKDRWNETKWLLKGPNERMRFLKYGPGQYFKQHCDGCYEDPDDFSRSFFTIHVYLNDSAQALGHPINLDEEDSPDALLEGGATTFHSNFDIDQRYDADPKIGRVLIFQQRGLWHSGDYVRNGVKYTMRSDLMYTQDLDFDLPKGSNDIQFTA